MIIGENFKIKVKAKAILNRVKVDNQIKVVMTEQIEVKMLGTLSGTRACDQVKKIVMKF